MHLPKFLARADINVNNLRRRNNEAAKYSMPAFILLKNMKKKNKIRIFRVFN